MNLTNLTNGASKPVAGNSAMFVGFVIES